MVYGVDKQRLRPACAFKGNMKTFLLVCVCGGGGGGGGGGYVGDVIRLCEQVFRNL